MEGTCGVRWQSAAPTALWEAPEAHGWDHGIDLPNHPRASGACQSGVALRFPPHSMGAHVPPLLQILAVFARGANGGSVNLLDSVRIMPDSRA